MVQPIYFCVTAAVHKPSPRLCLWSFAQLADGRNFRGRRCLGITPRNLVLVIDGSQLRRVAKPLTRARTFQHSLPRSPRDDGLPTHRSHSPWPRQCVLSSDRNKLTGFGQIEVPVRVCPLPNELGARHDFSSQAGYVWFICLARACSCHLRDA